MKSSEAIIRAIANEGGRIPAVQFDKWLGQLVAAGFLQKETIKDEFYYSLTDPAKEFLRKKGVRL